MIKYTDKNGEIKRLNELPKDQKLIYISPSNLYGTSIEIEHEPGIKKYIVHCGNGGTLVINKSSLYKVGDIKELRSYNYTDEEAKRRGILNVCYGHGDFERLKIGEDIEIVQ